MPAFPERPCSRLEEGGIIAFRKVLGPADQMCKACLAAVYPMPIHAVAITDKQPLPLTDEGLKSFVTAIFVNQP
jgi:hypothetical protein